MALATSLFDYSLPERLIAQTPAARRDAARLLVVERSTRAVTHTTFAELPRFLRTGDILFRNNAAVLPARLPARRPTGGAVECLLLRPAGDAEGREWWCLVRPGKKLPVGATFAGGHALAATPPKPETPGEISRPSVASDARFSPVATESGVPAAPLTFTGEILAKDDHGTARVRFTTSAPGGIVAVANQLGAMPLPPYIRRDASVPARATPPTSPSQPATHDLAAADRERYQTVYADRARQVAVAAPTAGLHFTPELLAQLRAGGVRVGETDITLHVGLGTFKPIATDEVDAHPIHHERYELPIATQQALWLLPGARGRRVAVGTTTVRTIEDFLAKHPAPLAPARDWTDEAALFIRPPATFRGVDALITNFHQPRSTLLCLVSAFLAPGTTEGIAWLHELYADAIARDYRFFSYGDAMLIL